jgi:adenylate kinase
VTGPRDVIFLGPPGAGKGTQARLLEMAHGLVQISTGDLLRDHRAKGSALGNAAADYMSRGELVPDALITDMMEAELDSREGGLLLDGFPRTVAQAEALDALFARKDRPPPVPVLLDIDLNLVARRLCGRWTNPRNGRVYHDEFAPPRLAGIDDDDGGPLIQRQDDSPETILTRLAVYRDQTQPLIEYYSSRGRLHRVDATRSVAEVTESIESALYTPPGRLAK